MPARPERSILRTMLAVCAIALIIAFISSTLVLARSAALSSWIDTATITVIDRQNPTIFRSAQPRNAALHVVSIKDDGARVFTP